MYNEVDKKVWVKKVQLPDILLHDDYLYELQSFATEDPWIRGISFKEGRKNRYFLEDTLFND